MIKKIKPRLTEEILRYSRILPPTKKYQMQRFASFIPYRGFIIVLANPLIEIEPLYKNSKYGWWQYCVMKNGMDRWDIQTKESIDSRFGTQFHENHLWCKDNQTYLMDYSLHPKAMVAALKKEIDIFLEEKDILKKRSLMSKAELKSIEKRAQRLLVTTVNQNKKRVRHVFISDKMAITNDKQKAFDEGWIIKGMLHTYFLSKHNVAYHFKPKSENHMQPICIESNTRTKYMHDYDHIVSKMLALLNDRKLKKHIHTIE